MQLNNLLDFMSKVPRQTVTLLALLFAIVIGILDHLAGYEITISIFYLIPIVLVTWFVNKRQGILFSVFSSSVWMLADFLTGHTYSSSAIPWWNAFARLCFYLLSVYSFTAIKELLEREQNHARIDPLTSLANSRAFKEMAESEINKASRFERPFTVAYMDIDNFKLINDTYGHSHGDELLRLIAKGIRDNVRIIDIVSRIGGDEFVFFFPETGTDSARGALEKVRQKLLDIVGAQGFPVTFSIGAVTCFAADDLDDILKAADRLMYTIKNSGKNRVEYQLYSPTHQ